MNLSELLRLDVRERAPLLRRARLLAEHLPDPRPGSKIALAFGKDRDGFATALFATWLRGHGAAVVENALRERIQPVLERDGVLQAPMLHDTGSGRAVQVPQVLAEAEDVGTLPPAPTTLPDLPDGVVLTVHVQRDDGTRTFCEWTADALVAALDDLAAALPTGGDPDDAPGEQRTPGFLGSLFVDTLLPLRRGRPYRDEASAAACDPSLAIEGAPSRAVDAALHATMQSLREQDGVTDVAAARPEDPAHEPVIAAAGPKAEKAAGLPDTVAFEQIPRDPNGQALAAELFLKAGRGRRGQPVQRELEWRTTDCSERSATRRTTLPADYLFYEGHFTGYPVLAGGVQLHELVLPCLRAVTGELPALQELDAVKFLARFGPGETIDVALQRADDPHKVSFEVRRGETRCTTGRLSFDGEVGPFAAGGAAGDSLAGDDAAGDGADTAAE